MGYFFGAIGFGILKWYGLGFLKMYRAGKKSARFEQKFHLVLPCYSIFALGTKRNFCSAFN
jgi:hypothetical protein